MGFPLSAPLKLINRLFDKNPRVLKLHIRSSRRVVTFLDNFLYKTYRLNRLSLKLINSKAKKHTKNERLSEILILTPCVLRNRLMVTLWAERTKKSGLRIYN